MKHSHTLNNIRLHHKNNAKQQSKNQGPTWFLPIHAYERILSFSLATRALQHSA